MKNEKLHIINELLNDFDVARTTNDIDKLIDSLEIVNQKIINIIKAHNKDDVFADILNFISVDILITIDNEIEKNDSLRNKGGIK